MDTVIIPAAGFGTRMQDIARGNSKELLQVKGKPAIQYALEEAAAAGLRQAGIVIREGKEEIREFIAGSKSLARLRSQLQIQFFYQPAANGECGAILAAERIVAGLPFLVHYPDNIILDRPGRVCQELQKQYSELQSDVVALSPAFDAHSHPSSRPMAMAQVRDRLYLLKPGEEQRSFHFGLRAAGVYVASPDFLEAARALAQDSGSAEIKDRQVQAQLAARGRLVYGLDVQGDILDVGSPQGLNRAIALL